MWKGVLDLVAAHPRRAILGWGPETMGLVFEPYQDPEITHLEHRYQRAGRAHNIVFDSFVSIGVVGAIALVAVWISVFSHLFQSMGLAATRTDAAIFVGVVVAASVAGALIAVKSAGVIWVALGGGAGFIGGLLLYAMWAAQRETTPPPNHGGADRLTLAAIAAALVAHIVEVQFSFETVSSALLFWADIGLAVAIGGRSAVQTLASDVGRDAPVVLPRPGLVTAFVLFVFIFDFCSVPGLLTTREGPAVALFVGVWLMATWIDVGAASFLTHAATLLALAALLFVALTGSIDARVAYGLLFALVAVGAAHRVPRAQARGHLDAWRPTMAALLAAFAAYGVVGNVKRSRAGTLAKLGKEYASRLQWEAAAPLLQEAARSEPDEGRHFADLGSMLVAQAQSVGGAAAQAQLQQAVAHVEHARVLQPAEVDHPATLAEFQATWATMSTTTAERDQHWDAAARLYAQTAAARPSHPGVWARWALLDRDRGRLDAAHAKLTKAIALDGESADLYLVRADVEIRARKYADALADFERAERLAPLTPDQARAKAILLERLR